MSEKDMPKADFITSLVLIAFSIVATVLSYKMPRFENRGASIWEAPGLVPALLAAIIGAFGVYLLVRSIRQGGFRLVEAGKPRDEARRRSGRRRLSLTVVLTLGYSLGLLGRVPYVIGTSLFIAVFIFLFEYEPRAPRRAKWKNALGAALTAAIATAFVAVVFQYGFLIRLP